MWAVGGWLADRVGRVPIVASGSLLSAAAVALLPLAAGRRSFCACMACWDVGENMMSAALTAYAADVTSETQRGAQNSLGNQVQDATFVVMPVLLGVVASRAGGVRAPLELTAALMLAATVTFTVLARSAAAPDEAAGGSD